MNLPTLKRSSFMLSDFTCQTPDEGSIAIDIANQILYCYYRHQCIQHFAISSAKNGLGEQENSGCTPRGLHEIAEIIGQEYPINAVLVNRMWTGEFYSEELGLQFQHRDWITSRILRLSGLEPGFNLGGSVDTFKRYIYIHGTPDDQSIGRPASHGCIRMRNLEVIELANWVKKGMKVFINHTLLKDFYPKELNIWSNKS